jgi:hypothetical protein
MKIYICRYLVSVQDLNLAPSGSKQAQPLRIPFPLFVCPGKHLNPVGNRRIHILEYPEESSSLRAVKISQVDTTLVIFRKKLALKENNLDLSLPLLTALSLHL